MVETLQCEDCGATLQQADARFCGYCGAAFKVQPKVVHIEETREAARERRFAALREHPEAQRHLRDLPTAAPVIAKHSFGLAGSLAFFVIFLLIANVQCGIASEVGRGFGSSSPVGSIAGLFPLLLFGFGAVLVYRMVKSGTESVGVLSSSTEAFFAVVLDESVEVRSRGDRSYSVSLLTIEMDGGGRETYEASKAIARRVTRDDMGVAYIRGAALVDFRVVGV